MISILRKDVDGNVTASYTLYKSFSYSKEYDLALQDASIDYTKAFFKPLTERGDGMLIEGEQGISEIFDVFVKTIEKVFDPRYLFIIIAVVLFIIEIAVRKFKFRWPHELIREYRTKRQ